MKQSINLCKIANLYITLLLPWEKKKKRGKKGKEIPFVLKRQRKNFRNKRNASAQQEKWEIAGICFRYLGMLLLTTTIQIKMLICSCSLIFKKKICWLFPQKKKKNPLPSVKSQRSYEWNVFGITEETPFKLALLELPIVTIQTMYNNKHSSTSNHVPVTRNSKSTALPISMNSPPKPSFAASLAKIY